jgi:inorganic pyrophosphatase
LCCPSRNSCPGLAARGAELVRLPGGHHFGGYYAALATQIADGLSRRSAGSHRARPTPRGRCGDRDPAGRRADQIRAGQAVGGRCSSTAFLHTAIFYPANYGFIPRTLSPDGDPLDCLVVGPNPVVPGAMLRSRPIGALLTEDENGADENILAVPVDALHPFYRDITRPADLPEILLQQIAHFLSHYKDLEPGKWVSIKRWTDAEEAFEIVRAGIERAARSGG